jgi:hypothetical protein
MKHFRKNQRVTMTEEAIENYGEQWRAYMMEPEKQLDAIRRILDHAGIEHGGNNVVERVQLLADRAQRRGEHWHDKAKECNDLREQVEMLHQQLEISRTVIDGMTQAYCNRIARKY